MPTTARATQAEDQDASTPDTSVRASGAREGSLGDATSRPGALASPAARLQAALGAEYAQESGEERWPLRWTVAAVFTSCGAFWTAVYFLVAALIG